MKITVLAENTAINQDFEAEHGLSLYIETEKDKILFDFGQSDLFLKNAEKSGVDLKNIDFSILSHGHYDHGGGIAHFLKINPQAKIFINESAFFDYYNGTEKYIGIDKSFKSHPQIQLVGDSFEIKSGFSLYSCNNREKIQPTNPFGLKKWENGVFQDDDFLHEHYLLVEEKGKTILFSGCSHKGLLNIVDWFKPDVFVGGFHFSKIEDNNQLKEIAERLKSYNTKYYTCHCTGVEQFNILKSVLGDRLEYLSTGKTVFI